MLLNKTIRLFLDSIGRREEYEFYLRKFQSADAACFAVLVPDGESLGQGAEVLAFDLHFLLQLGLKTVILLAGADAEEKWGLLAEEDVFTRTAPGELSGNLPVIVDPEKSVLDCLEAMVPETGKRVHFIRAAGGFKTDYYYLNKIVDLTVEEAALAETAGALLAARPGVHVSVTSPINLLQEIFTVRGAGTVFRHGSVILHNPETDRSKLRLLLADSFGREIREEALDAATECFIEENYRGAALLEAHPAGLYLSKFAVGREARGEGLAQELWDEVCKNHPAFFWRSRAGNPINQWYDRHSDGHHTAKGWQIFWRGVSAEQLSDVIAFCLIRFPDFV